MAALVLSPGSASGQTERVERTAWLMGTRARIEVEAPSRRAAVSASEAALRALTAAEARLSTWRDDSELSRLNRTPLGEVVEPGPELARLLGEVASWIETTDGAFHPDVGALVDAWGLRSSGRIPTSEELRLALDATGEAGISIDSSGSVVRWHANAWLDAGAFGKGAALRDALAALERQGVRSARVDLGGEILALGDMPLTVSVADPADRATPLYELRLADASVATTGQSERGFERAGERFGHVLDPRDGRPVPAWGSVTVVHADPLAADILATALFVLGPEEGLALAESLDGVAALFLTSTGAGVVERATTAMRQEHSLRSIQSH
jgi:thiamine biosynthesis lipoprotein